MWPFNKKTNYKGEVIEYLKHSMLGFIKNHPEMGAVITQIYSDATQIASRFSEKSLRKELIKGSVNIEFAALNILQNCCMLRLKQIPATEYVAGTLSDNDEYKESNIAHFLYDYVNELKLNKGYISETQYKENKLLGIKLSVRSPLGQWMHI